ncbi:MAG: radical SAM protein [bacterium]|nr:radical SAM protein [bacterium]
MNLYRLWHDTLGSAGGIHISPRLWGVLLRKPPHHLLPFLYTQIIRGRIFNALSRQIRSANMFIPKQIIIEPTYDCNLACPMCYIDKTSDSIKPDLLEFIVKDGKKLGVSRYVLMGGEPTFRNIVDLMLPIIKANRDCFFTFCTNGTLIDDYLIKQFKDRKNISFIFSIDGPEHITDELREKGTYQKAMANLTKLKMNNLGTAVSITTSPDHWEEQLSIDFIYSLFKKGVFVFYSHFIVANHKINMPNVDKIKLMLHIQSIVKKIPVFFNEGYYGKMTPGGIVPRENHQIVIDPTGNVRIDRFSFEKTYGSLTDESLTQILSKAQLIEDKRKSREEANYYLEGEKEELRKHKFRVFQPRVLY